LANAANLVNFGTAGGSLAVGDWTYSAYPLSAPSYLPLNNDTASYLVSSYPTLATSFTTPAAAYSATSRNQAVAATPTGIAYGNGIWVTVPSSGTGFFQTSTDGITWTQRPLFGSLASVTNWSGIIYANGYFLALPNSFVSGAVSTDGVNWSVSTMPVNTTWAQPAYGNGVWVIISQGGSVYTSQSPAGPWNAITTLGGGSATYSSVAYGNGVFVSISDNSTNASYYSINNGISWTTTATTLIGSFTSITYGNGVFVALKSGTATCFTSPDGSTWTSRTMPVSTTWKSVTWGNGVFLAVSNTSGTIAASSPDGITWTARVLPATQIWQQVKYGGPTNAGYFVAGSNPLSAGIATINLSVTQTTFNLPVIASNSSNTVTYIKAS